jgi:hypothetical protein
MLSLYFCRAVRVDCPASYMRRRQIILILWLIKKF